MPTYEYECLKCKYKFEAFQTMNAVPLKKCPKCGKAVKRLIGAGAGIIFKGSGFYATDYKAKGRSSKQEENICPASGSTCGSKECPKMQK
ncbi:MAG: FmdB family transcriptional regulator [Candidatus Omnitrophica bacterium CG11_big_fil_rev_8_21_14_0_20_42_13]|uniref:FmdB family transcriptional regulator n=1 Tax=Candidatus Ghiorseimicrobium undicola TaxID=1974746 RepID=A0A2H0LV74_9BACT|nr:MAG: FmdB family transcriptional regulator [Candidatus Omnitrophica bacterium CG11_big_fil_rev_8_21_14_0_20_42_13]